jgi:hypothetical protein
VGAEGGPGRRDQIRTAVVHEGTAALPGGLRPDETFPIAFRAGVPEIVAHVQRTGAAEAFLAPGTPAAVGTILRDLGIAAVTRSGPPEQLGLGGGR